jgi:cytochrome c peroxidase
VSATAFWKRTLIGTFVVLVAVWQTGCGGTGAEANSDPPAVTTPTDLIPSLQAYTTPTGTVSTYVSTGSIDPTGIFFEQLGANGRTCTTCHQLSQGMSINAASTLALFSSTSGTDPLFAAVDGANCPTAVAGDATGHSLMLDKALVRIAIELPLDAQFTIATINDPYGCAITADPTTGRQIVSVYRRPLPAASLPYLSNIMWDTRETLEPLNTASTFAANLNTDLTAQAVNAIATHMQSTVAPTAAQETAILALEDGLFTAQATDALAGSLSTNGATGGAANLAAQNFHPGINDAFGQDPQGARFNPAVFGLYQAWGNSANAQQASIARGQGIFNTAPLTITDVRGLNDNPALGSPTVIRGSCGTCHDTPNVGNHSLPLPMDTGTARLAASETDPLIIAGLGQLAAADVPIYQITGCTDANGNAVIYTTTDPGTGLFTGLCADVNRVKVPVLRGLAARAPYFHNGSADNLNELVNFYNARFQMNLNPQQLTDLVNFLNAL